MISRHKNRYLLMEASAQLEAGSGASSALLDALDAEMGHTGFLRANPKIVHRIGYHSFIIRVNRGYEHDIILATAFVKRVAGMDMGLYTLSTSGTIRRLLNTADKMYGGRSGTASGSHPNQKG